MTEDNKNPLPKIVVLLGAIMVVINFIVGFLAYPHLPEKVPVHWNFAGEVDGWGSAFQGAFLLPGAMLLIYLLLIFVPRIDPKRKSYALMGKAYGAIILGVMILFTLIYFGMLGAALGYFRDIPTLVQVGVGLLFIVIGNYMGKLKHNYFAGIRTPWTLANEEVWNKTHRIAGPLWVAGGVLFIVISLVSPGIMSKALIVIIAGLTLVPVLYSLFLYRKLTKGE